ncbi:MATE family efflux transporter [Reinekea sp.]|uniref:MATE family efflux transporter n=1 Tax=Reinekea sp. TaxID=1970455 RepID=UPI00257D4D57|nr:MATE family efflux transporter [Reinekea sp.]
MLRSSSFWPATEVRRVCPRALAAPIISLAVPIMIQGVLMNLMGFVDALMIGQLGETAIAALGNAQQLVSFLFLLMAALSIGGSVLIAQQRGAKNPSAINDSAMAMVQIGLLAGLLLGALVWFFAESLVGLLTTDLFRAPALRSSVPQVAATYLHLIAFALPAMLLSQLLTGALNALGDTRTPVKVAVSFNLVNFILNYVLIFGLGFPGLWAPVFAPLGLVGAALATLIAATGQAMVLFCLARGQDNGLDLSLKRLFRGYGATLKTIFRLGYPNTIDGFYWQGARVFYTVLINSLGAIAYAAYAIVRTLKTLFILPIGGLQTATAVRIGQLLGAGQFQRAKATAWIALWLGLALMTVPASLLIVFAKPLLALYAITPETERLAYLCTWVLAGSLFFTAINAVIPGLLRAGGDAAAVMHITLLSFILCGAPLAWLLGVYGQLGLVGAFVGISLEEVFKAALFVRRMRQYRWLNQLATG